MVTIEAGAEMEHFTVHSSYLCAKSPFFKATVGSLQDGILGIIRLPHVPTVLFRIFIAWLYHGCLWYLPPLGRTVDEDFESLKITKESLEQNFIQQIEAQNKPSYEESDSEDSDDDARNIFHGSVAVTKSGNDTELTREPVQSAAVPVVGEAKYQGDDPTSWPPQVFLQLYMLADCFQIRELRADALDALVRATETSVLDLSYIPYIYSKTSVDSPLRKYVVHDAAYRRSFGKDASSYAALPAEFLAAVMVTNTRRLPSKLCKGCHGAGLRVNPVSDPQLDDRDPEQDCPPYKIDLCFYHEHPDEEERKACRLRREGAKSAV